MSGQRPATLPVVVTHRTCDGMVYYTLGTVECFAWWHYANGDETDVVSFEFRGKPQQLAAAGIASLESLARPADRPCGKARIDAEGDEIKLAGRSWKSGVVKIEVKKPLDRALRHLPDFAVVDALLERFRRPPTKA